jgi:hypothetical protein
VSRPEPGEVFFVQTGFAVGDKVRRKGQPHWGTGVIEGISEERQLVHCRFEGTVQGGFQFGSVPEKLEKIA